jgi:hypothetical protein
MRLDDGSAAKSAGQEADHEQNNEREQKELGDGGGRAGEDEEAQGAGDDSQNGENNGPTEHGEFSTAAVI